MIDFGFAALLALITLGVGKRLLDWLGQTPGIRSMRSRSRCRWEWARPLLLRSSWVNSHV